MRFFPFSLPDGWPVSLWFLIATAVLFLLQRFPYTGIFLMIVGAMVWSVLLINLGFIGIGLEALSGRVSRLWLILPVLYFGGYYLAYAKDQAALAALRADFARNNAGKTMPFDPDAQDLVVEKGKGDFHPSAFDFVQRFGLRRVYDAGGAVHFMGDREACKLLRDNDVFRSAGVYGFGFHTGGGLRSRRLVDGFCSIKAPGAPEKPLVRVHSDDIASKSLLLPVRKQELRIRDERSGQAIELWSGHAMPLKAFPMPYMGCALNSGAPSWDCAAGFMRSTQPLLPGGSRYSDTAAMIAGALGLKRSDDFAAIASGPEPLRKIGEAADKALIDKEMAKLGQMLADPTQHVLDGWFFHLPNRPAVVEPYAGRIFAALATLQRSDVRSGENGRNLWRLVAVMSDEVLAPYRAQIVEWLRPENAREWTAREDSIYERLDASDPIQREIMLHRIESERGDLKTGLLGPFCTLGASAADEVKRRLLRLWNARGVARPGYPEGRGREDVMLYFTLARMGLKEAAGKVEQRYYGPTFLRIWEEVGPNSHANLCSGSINDLSNAFRRR